MIFASKLMQFLFKDQRHRVIYWGHLHHPLLQFVVCCRDRWMTVVDFYPIATSWPVPVVCQF